MKTKTNNFAEQLRKLLYEKGMSQTDFADVMGWNKSKISRYMSGTNYPNDSTIMVIKKKFPSFGEGDPDLVPYYNVDITAGGIDLFSDNLETPDDYVRAPGFQDCDFALPVYGHSMKPIITNGDKVICKQIKDFDFFNYGETYVVITDEQRLVKFLRKNTQKGFVTLASHNKDYDDIDMPIGKIRNLYLVKGILKRNQ